MDGKDKSDVEEQESVEASSAVGDIGVDEKFGRVRRASAFGQLMQNKRKFLVPIVVFYLVFYMLWPVLAELTPVLDGRAIGAMTWAMVYGFAQVAMVLVVTHLFLRQANKWDVLAEEARREASGGSQTT
jgi:uncharacterized membrane protein (DUF485 family)